MKAHNSRDLLTEGLKAVAEDEQQLGSSSAVGLRLLAEVQAIAAARRRRAVMLSLGTAAAMFVVVLTMAGPRRVADAIRGTRPTAEVSQAERGQPDDAPILARELVTEFFPLRYSNVPARGGYVVRMQVPRGALASFGVTPPAGDVASPSVLADVVIGDDGLARAVRFVRVISDGGPASASAPSATVDKVSGYDEQEQRP